MRLSICLPGESFSSRFMVCLVKFQAWLQKKKIPYFISLAQSCNIYYVRNKCLGGNYSLGINQPLFGGEEYTHILWVDSDQNWIPEHFELLLQYPKYDIIAGTYLTQDGERLTCGKLHITPKYVDNIPIFQSSYTKEDLKNAVEKEQGITEVDYNGMGFMLIKKGVYESIQYPWHKPRIFSYTKDDGVFIKDFSMEDVGFLMDARDAGYRNYVVKQCIVGHEKKVIL